MPDINKEPEIIYSLTYDGYTFAFVQDQKNLKQAFYQAFQDFLKVLKTNRKPTGDIFFLNFRTPDLDEIGYNEAISNDPENISTSVEIKVQYMDDSAENEVFYLKEERLY